MNHDPKPESGPADDPGGCYCGNPYCTCGGFEAPLIPEQKETLLQQEWDDIRQIAHSLSPDIILHVDGNGNEWQERAPDAWDLK